MTQRATARLGGLDSLAEGARHVNISLACGGPHVQVPREWGGGSACNGSVICPTPMHGASATGPSTFYPRLKLHRGCPGDS